MKKLAYSILLLALSGCASVPADMAACTSQNAILKRQLRDTESDLQRCQELLKECESSSP